MTSVRLDRVGVSADGETLYALAIDGATVLEAVTMEEAADYLAKEAEG